MPLEPLELLQAGPVARILIDHPQRRNAFTRAMWRALPALVARALDDPRTRVVTLESAHAGLFVAGADISEFEDTYTRPGEAAVATREIQDAVDALAACPLPVVAVIDGACVGGGVSLAIACDLRIASDRARFAVKPARLGLSYHPDDLRRLVRVCGFADASELLFAGQLWTADRALRSRLVNQVWPTQSLAAEAATLMSAIAENSDDAVRSIKQGLRAVADRDPGALEQAGRKFLDLFDGPDFIEGRDAFLQKRAARFPSHHAPSRP